MNKKILIIIVFLLVIGIFVYERLNRTNLEKSFSKEKISLGVAARESSALIYIAEKKGFFKKEGLEVSLTEHETGLSAVNDLLAGKVDVATAAEFVFVTKSLEKSELLIFATIAKGNDCECIARRDRGIEKPSDLIGKRIGVVPGMQAEFFFYSFLSLNGIRREEIKTIEIKPAEIIGAIGEGRIDAVITGLNTEDIKDRLGRNGISWSAQGGQDYFFALITGEKFIQSRALALHRLLKALLEAEQLVKKDRRGAQEILKSSLKLDPAEERVLWDKNKYEVRLDQALLTIMEDEARWAIRKGLTREKQVPNYLKSVSLDGLKRIKPESISIIH